jgi:hypothetical protein
MPIRRILKIRELSSVIHEELRSSAFSESLALTETGSAMKREGGAFAGQVTTGCSRKLVVDCIIFASNNS